LILYVFGIPVLIVAILYFGYREGYLAALTDPTEMELKSKEYHGKVKRFLRYCGVLFCKYKGQFWWWELVLLVRKLFVVAAILFFTRYVMVQMVFTYMTLLVALLLETYLRPYLFLSDNILEILLLSSTTLILFIGMLIYAADSSSLAENGVELSSALNSKVLGPIAIAVVVISFAIALSFIIYHITRMTRGVLVRFSSSQNELLDDAPPTPTRPLRRVGFSQSESIQQPIEDL